MAAFKPDRDYTLSYLDASNKSLYAQNAISAFATSGGARFEQRLFLIILENYRSFVECGVDTDGYGVVISVKVKSQHLYDLAYMVEQAFAILRSVENWAEQVEFDEEEEMARLHGTAFNHSMRTVQDAFGFVTGHKYREWFRLNQPLLKLFRKFKEGGELRNPVRRFIVGEDFIDRWELAVQPESISLADFGGFGFCHFRSGEGWVQEAE